MVKFRISLWRGKRSRSIMVGSQICNDEEVCKVIQVIQDSLAKHFPEAEIIRAKAVRELFGV